MKSTVARIRVLLAIGSFFFVAGVHAQTMEIYAGQGRYVDAPGNTVGLQPNGMVASPDGYIYITDLNGALMRLNPANGTVTALPAISGGLNLNLPYAHGMAIDPFGRPHIASWQQLLKIEPDGTQTSLGSLEFSGPMAFGPDGTLYIIPVGTHRVWARLPGGTFQVIAGAETPGFQGDGGPALNARFNGPEGLAVGPDGYLYISDTDNNRIRRISNGVITTVAGNGTTGFFADGLPALNAPIAAPWGLTFDEVGNLFVAARSGYRILRIDAISQLVTTVAGNGTAGYSGDGGPATSARLAWPRFLAVDAGGNVYFSDYEPYHYIRRVDASTGIVTRAIGMAGSTTCGVDNTPASQQCLNIPRGMAIDPAGDLLVADSITRSIKKIAAGTRVMSTLKYLPSGSPMAAEFDAAGNLYYIDWGGSNYTVDRIDAVTGATTRVMTGVIATDLAVDAAGNLYVTDGNSRRILRVDAVTQAVTTFVSSLYAYTIEFDPSGNLIASGSQVDCSLHRINVNTRVVTRIAGTGTCGGPDPQGGTYAPSTPLGRTGAFAVERDGNILVAWSQRLLRINMTTGIISRINPPSGPVFRTPEGVTFMSPDRMQLDSAGNVFISQNGTYPHNFIFKFTGVSDSTPPAITPNISGIAGTGDWYRSNVNVSWTVTDAESTVTSMSGCSSSSVTQDTTGITYTCSATSAGGTTSRSVTIRRDTVAPTLTFGAQSPAPDAEGWNNTAVTFPSETADPLSGVYMTSGSGYINSQGAGLTTQVVVTDRAGNSATFTTPPVNIDWTPPIITPVLSGTRGGEGWFVSDVQVSWDIVDPHSPVVPGPNCADSVVNVDASLYYLECTARSAGGQINRSVYLSRDATPPTLTFGAPSPAPNAAGWNTTDVTIPFTVSDSGSLPIPNNPESPVVITGSGAGLTTSVTVWDRAGNSTTLSTPPVNIDRSPPPTVTPVIAGTLGNAGWYRSDVQVSWTLTGNILSSSGCGNSSVTTDTAGITFTCSASSGVSTTSNSVTIKRDTTAPQLTFGTRTPAPNSRGWNSGNVSFPFTTSDILSGVASTSTPSPVVITGSGAGITGQVTVNDQAGNSATFTTAAVNIDRTVAVITPVITGTLGNNGWYRSNVQLTWTVDELPGSIDWTSGCGTYNVTADTAGVSYTCGVQSAAGYTSKTVSIKRDATAPVVTFSTPTPAANANGWNSTNVSVPFTRSDARSGLASTSTTSPLILSAEGAGITGQVVVTDNAGNSATFTSPARNIDKTASVVTIVSPANGASYGVGENVSASFSCTDTNPQSCAGTAANGTSVDTSSAGARTFTVTGTDLAGNTTTVVNTYTVQ